MVERSSTDIVEQLRHLAGGGSGPVNEICADAIEEIESLKAQVTIAKKSNGFHLLEMDARLSAAGETPRPNPCPQEAHDHCVWPRCDCGVPAQGSGKRDDLAKALQQYWFWDEQPLLMEDLLDDIEHVYASPMSSTEGK